MSGEDKIRNEIRGRLMRFTNCRERAYEYVRKKGHPVPDYTDKVAAILFIRIHLQASASWDLKAHIRLIAKTLRVHIETLLPFEFHDDKRQLSYRRHIEDLMKYCDREMPKIETQLFNLNPADMNKPIVIYSGPPGSGKSRNMELFATTKGLSYKPNRWADIYGKREHIIKMLAQVGGGYLFIQDLPFIDVTTISYLRYLVQDIGVKVVATTLAQNEVNYELILQIKCSRGDQSGSYNFERRLAS